MSNRIIAGKQNTIKEVNKSLIINIIKNYGPITGPDLTKMTNLSLPTVNKTINNLLDESIIQMCGIADSTGGRRPNIYDLNYNKKYLIIFLESNSLEIVSITLSEKVLKKKQYEIDFVSCKDVFVELYKVIDEFISDTDISQFEGIGIGVPGIVDKANYVRSIPSIEALSKKNIKKNLESKYGIQVKVERDVVFSTIGVYNTMLNKKYSNVVYLFFSKGVGLGLIINNRLYKGASNAAGEIGYIVTQDELAKVDDQNLESYRNGEKGLYEACIDTTLNRICEQFLLSDTDDLKKALIKHSNNSNVQELRKLIASGLVNVISLFDPEAIIIDGYFFTQEFLMSVKEYMSRYLCFSHSPLKIMVSDAEDLGIKGAVNYCFIEMNGLSRVTNDFIL